MLSKINSWIDLSINFYTWNQHWVWASFVFKAAFARVFQEALQERFLEASRRRLHSSSGFSPYQFVLFLHNTPDRLMMIRSHLCVEHWLFSDKNHWIITINDKNNVFKCKLIFPTDTLHQNIEITDLKPFLAGGNTSVVKMLTPTAYNIILKNTIKPLKTS